MAQVRTDIQLLPFQLEAGIRQDGDAIFIRQIALALHRVAVIDLQAQVIAGDQQRRRNIQLEA
ncbi:hypothetical protein D3C72_835310 [compost metagenome]